MRVSIFGLVHSRFRTSPEYLQWKNLLHHYYDPFPTVEHYETVFANRPNG
ncbi:hypothetical protein [Parapedobacter tibetensis]|nr:hypothetical protein [Parapedobacter tibetensis]